MVTGLVPPANLWDVDEIVDVQVGAEVWAVSRSLADGGLWDVPFIANPKPEHEVAAVQDLNFWDSLLMKDIAEDLGLNTGAPVAALATDKGKHKLGEVPSDLWDVNQDPQVVPSSRNVLNVTRSGRIFQAANLQAGSSSNPSNQRNEPIAFLGSAPLELPSTDLIQRQLEWVPTAISLWGLICLWATTAPGGIGVARKEAPRFRIDLKILKSRHPDLWFATRETVLSEND
ncbi:hypothetical protein RHMOL_Rhmol02G0192800 [Rhododendron molle]|uniref:Uncharacterized protein n=1 Tax=Rhododendron molle TaxID=49168 RepID=A0ACC0PT92_RHOML|nr:hypothetical protein RHMOL_Rhmol02G0192800 [Rhododendron molle]